MQREDSPRTDRHIPERRRLLDELLRPWKLATFAFGVIVLVLGAQTVGAPDWDVPISLIMATLAYVAAPWTLRVLLERRWRAMPFALFATWFTVDGCYWIYWSLRNPAALAWMRSANAPASLALYGLCGVLWLYRGSLRELFAEATVMVRSWR